jgi:hypothetical protein
MYITVINTTYVQQHSDEITITSWLHVSAVKQPSSRQSRTYTKYNYIVLIYKVLYLYVLLWPDDDCFIAKTCSSDITDVSSLC